MLANITCAVREFLGIPQMQERLADSIDRVRRELNLAVTRVPEAVLACVTVLAVTSDGERIEDTAFGAEAFIYPGEAKTVDVPYPQRNVGRMLYFISGHPNLVITSFNVGNHHTMSNNAGVKFGKCSTALEVGNTIKVRVEYRVPGQV